MPPPPSPLEVLEAQVGELQAALVAADPATVQQRALAVRSATAALADWLDRTPFAQHTEEIRQRIRALGAQLNSTRDQLARVMSLTSQQAASLLPPADLVTYGPAATSKARIYRAPG
jgi:hypothetical protein